MIPTLQRAPGLISPGQLGPMSRTGSCSKYRATFTMSNAGTPSVMQAMSGIPASADSTMASAAKGGGTKISAMFGLTSATACSTELKTGTLSSNTWPPRPGVTPATTLVP